ncbi:MAG TPA: cache domain-containing protein, partial [Woeseiaceae bacterium]|nr:cache domain-containing protein [Woeseiaceae bacterium]
MSEATSRFDWLRPRGYFAKFVLSFIGLVVFVLLVNGGLETWFMYRETTQLVVKSEGEKAEATARRVEQFLSETERQISWATRASTTTVEQRNQDYQLLLQQVPAIERAIYLDSGGREQVRLTRQTFVAGSNLDYSGDPRFKEAQGKSVWWSQVYFNGREPFMAVSAAHSGRNAGSTVAEISLKFLSDYIERTQIGQDTEAFVVDRLGRLLAHSDSNEALGSNYSSLPQVASLLNNTATPMMGTDPDGTRVLTASATIRQHDWYVFFGQPVNTALRPVYNLVFRTGWLLLLGIVLSILAGMLLAQRLVTPIKALQVGARQLESSNFGHRIEVRSRDEMGELADQFNRMADELQGSYGRLEQKVEERTR